MFKKIRVGLRPIVRNINLPTVIKTARLPGIQIERLFIATQVGEIYYVGDEKLELFLDLRQQVLPLGGASGGYDERGLLGLAFHPEFHYNGLFYLHYSLSGTQGPGALSENYQPNPCDPNTLNLKWTNREDRYDHIDTVEEWILPASGRPRKRRTLLNLRRPFMNHNGVNSLNFSPESGKLVLTTGDGGSGYDPFNLSQDDMEIAGKIIEIDVRMNPQIDNLPIVTRFDELPPSIQATLTVIAKGIRNIPGISYQPYMNQYIKYVGQVGQDLTESIFAFLYYRPIPVPILVQSSATSSGRNEHGLLNFGWRGWEGNLPTMILQNCSETPRRNQKTVAFYNEVLETSINRIEPLISYYHQDARPGKFEGVALNGVQSYMGIAIPDLTGSVVFTDFAGSTTPQNSGRGVLAYTRVRPDWKQNDFQEIDIQYDFGSQSAYFVSLGTNRTQTRLFLGVYGSMNVTNFNQGTVYEVVPVY